MKKTVRNFSLALMLLLSFNGIFTNAFAQAPNLISYQVVVRNAGNALLANLPVGMQVSILQGSASGTAVYVETQMPTTNINGLATIQIGGGTVVSGDFTTINWASGPYFIKTETDPAGGTSYSIVATQQLLSVPYAIYAATSGSSTPGPAGNGIVSTVDNGNGTFTITYSDASTFTTANLTGPQGVAGNDGAIGPIGPQGPAGVLSVNCLQCHDHNSTTSGSAQGEAIANAQYEYELSKHGEGVELAVEEGFSSGCAPCHSNEGYHSVVDASTIPTYTLASGKYTFSYNASAAASSGLTTLPSKISCFTCHKGAAADSMNLYSVAPVPMTMYATNTPYTSFDKTINLTQKAGASNLCVKCHQPRPMNLTSSTSVTLANNTVVTLNVAIANGTSVNYQDLAANPTAMFYDSIPANANLNKLFPSYRMHNHYGSVGAIFAGMGGVEFVPATTPVPYTNSTHSTDASCQDCHMATPTSFTGAHTFRVSYVNETTFAKTYNFKGCNNIDCHSTPLTATSSTWVNKRAATLTLLNAIAQKLKSGGIEIMHKNPVYPDNIFALVTPSGYDGYLDIYDPSSNPDGLLQNPIVSSSWTAANKATNLALPRLTSLKNVQMGAIINFQLSLREFSLGVHNPSYTDALLTNTLQALTEAGF